MTRIGFVGLGAMGTPMARNLLRGGHQVSVFARRTAAVAALAADGAVQLASPAEVAAASDVVFTMVTDTAAVEAVVLGTDGIVSGARPGTVVVDHSTIDPGATVRIAAALAARGVVMLDAPVSGGVAGAEAGSLVMMVGGAQNTFERCDPLLALNAKTRVYMGPSGAGQMTKACTQICIVVNQMGVAEALHLAARAGLDLTRVLEALRGGFAASRVLEMQGPKMVEEDFAGRIESRLHHKDVHVALDVAQSLGLEMPASSVAADALDRLQRAGGATLDSAAVFTVTGPTQNG